MGVHPMPMNCSLVSIDVHGSLGRLMDAGGNPQTFIASADDRVQIH